MAVTADKYNLTEIIIAGKQRHMHGNNKILFKYIYIKFLQIKCETSIAVAEMGGREKKENKLHWK